MAGIASPSSAALPASANYFDAPAAATALPPAAPADFQTSPTPLDQPHPQYPTLTTSHVAVLQAIGTPEIAIQQIAAEQPQAEWLDRYIQGEIMQNPEGWDDFVGNPRGTARAGLLQLIPGIQLPPPGAGSPGYMPDGSLVSGINVPGINTPLLDPGATPVAPQGDGEGLVKGLVIAAAAIGVGVLGWKLLKNRKAAEGAAGVGAKALGEAFGATGGGAASGVAGSSGIAKLGEAFLEAGAKAGDAGVLKQGALISSVGAGAGATAGGTSTAATLHSILNGLGPADGRITSLGLASLGSNVPMETAMAFHLMDRAVETRQMGEFAAATVAMRQALAAPAGGALGAAQNVGARQLLAGLQNLLPA